jgi:hypothetical protein
MKARLTYGAVLSVLGIAAGLPSMAWGQEQALEFAAALARSQGGQHPDSVHIVVGGVPESVESLVFIPVDSRVLGSIEGPTAVSVLATTHLSEDSIAHLYDAELPKRGWHRIGPRGGFVAAPLNPLAFCRGEGWQMSITTHPRRDGPTDLRVGLLRPGRAQCDEEEPGLQIVNLLPRLRPPADSRLWEASCVGIGWSQGGGFVLTGMGPDSLLSHYGRQMLEAGWQRLGDSTPASARSWGREDDRGRRVLASLMVMADPRNAGCQTVVVVTNRDRTGR